MQDEERMNRGRKQMPGKGEWHRDMHADLTVERMYRALPHPQRPIAMFLVS